MFTKCPVLRQLFTFAISFLLVATFTPLKAQQQKPIGADTKPYTLVYKLKPQAEGARISDAPLQDALKKIGAKDAAPKFPNLPANTQARRAAAPEISRIYQLTYASNVSFERARNVLMASGLVEYVEPLYERVPFFQPNDPAADSTKTTQYQYYLKLINAYQGWGVEKGDTNVVIGILDTGFRLTHEDLAKKVKRNYLDPIDGIDNDGDGYIDNFAGWDFADNDNDVRDNTRYAGHGSNVAGIAVGTPNNGVGMAGIGYNIMFMPIKVFSSSSGGFAGYEALVYAANRGCSVLNLSWGGETFSQFEQDVINYVVLEKNVVVIASGGNTAGNLNFYPASYDNVISVGGTDANDIKFTSYTHSYNIDITAPSRSNYTTGNSADNAYNNASGTSHAAPMVSGSAALLRSQYPHLNARQIMELLRVSSDDIYHIPQNQPFKEMLGKGRLNLKKALKLQNQKSVRCTSFKLQGKYAPFAGSTANINAEFINFLAPVSNLEITLTTASPFVTITKGTLNAGAAGTMSSFSGSSQPTFSFKVADNAPANLSVAFRLGYKDGSYEDFQYFVIRVNHDFLTMDANNLKVTVNSKGNLGYNGFKFTEGDGVRYKGGNPMLFEGGLLIAASNTRVSDNLRAKMWENDNDFVPTSITRRHLNTPLATQEIRNVMHDDHKTPNEPNVGVEVKQITYGWNTPEHSDFIILEYHIKNSSTETFEKLYTGLFADWDIGEYYMNLANWDETTQLGYVHHATSTAFPYAGIKLLSDNNPSYYALDNAGVEEDIVIEDSFTSEEKFKTLSNGIARKNAGKNTGNNVSHVVGATLSNMAPGEKRVVAFALLAADNLEALKAHALAAQQKYESFRTSPMPVAKADTTCIGGSITWVPEGGSKFNFYADQQKAKLLGSGPSYKLDNLVAETTIYAAGADSLFESNVATGIFALPKTPVAAFEVEGDIVAGQEVVFINKSINAKNWRWKLESIQPFTDKNLAYTFDKPGSYEITLTVSDRYNCSEVSTTKKVEVKAANITALPKSLADQLQVYPNPTTGQLHIKMEGNTMHTLPEVVITDLFGKTLAVPVTRKNEVVVSDLSDLAAGIYLARINYEGMSVVKRIVLVNP